MRVASEMVTCGACGGALYRLGHVCDVCGKTEVRESRDPMNGLNAPPPTGWLLLQEYGPHGFGEPPAFCSLSCLTAYVEGKSMAQEEEEASAALREREHNVLDLLGPNAAEHMEEVK